jgi:hypothetical protein
MEVEGQVVAMFPALVGSTVEAAPLTVLLTITFTSPMSRLRHVEKSQRMFTSKGSLTEFRANWNSTAMDCTNTGLTTVVKVVWL